MLKVQGYKKKVGVAISDQIDFQARKNTSITGIKRIIT